MIFYYILYIVLVLLILNLADFIIQLYYHIKYTEKHKDDDKIRMYFYELVNRKEYQKADKFYEEHRYAFYY